MNVHVKSRMTVDQFLDWAMGRPERCELHRGEVHSMSPETVGHIEIKGLIHSALLSQIRRSDLRCHALADGATVRIDDETAYEPDALVYCGDKLSRRVVEVPNPAIVVEVLSPSSRQIDGSLKLVGYFRLPSVMHYLIFDPDRPTVVHHARDEGSDILTRVVTEGSIVLAPPGLELALGDIYAT